MRTWTVAYASGSDLSSPGDDEEHVERFVKPLIKAGCQVIVCATRTDRSTSVRALEGLSRNEPPYNIEWIRKHRSSLNDAEPENRKMASKIVKKLFEIVGIATTAA